RVNAPGDGGVEPTLHDRLSGLSRAELGGLVALVAITVGGAGLWYARSLPRPVEVRAATALPAPAASATSSPGVVPILVDVAGLARSSPSGSWTTGRRTVRSDRWTTCST